MLKYKRMYRILKQVIYGAFYLAIIGGAAYWLTLKLFLPPSCTNGIKDQGETGIDCGGPCMSCEIKTLAAPQVTTTVFFENFSRGTVDLAAQIKNPNPSWGIRHLGYEFILKGIGNKEIDRVPGETFLLPGESMWLVQPSITKPSETLVGVTLNLRSFQKTEWQKVKPFAREAGIITRNVRFMKIKPPQVGFAALEGEVQNRSNFSLDEVEVSGVLYDAGGNVIAVGRTIVRTLKPGEARFFSIQWPNPFPGNVARFEANGRSNFLLDINFLKKFGE